MVFNFVFALYYKKIACDPFFCQLTSKFIPVSIPSVRAHLWLDHSSQHAWEHHGNRSEELEEAKDACAALLNGRIEMYLSQKYIFRDIFSREAPVSPGWWELWA